MAAKKQSPALGKSISATLQKGESLEELVRRAVVEAIKPFVDKLNETDQRVGLIESEVKTIKAAAGGAEKSALESASLVKATKKELKVVENQLIGLQVERTQTILRLQNVKEEENEDLWDLVSELLATPARTTKEEVKSAILEVRRASSKYATKRQLPREIIIDFSTKKIRDTILYNSYNADLDFMGLKVKILKDVPFLVRKRRFKYKKFAALLRDHGIKYKWLFPEGIWFRYKDQAYKILSEDQLKDFENKNPELCCTENEEKEEPEGGGEEESIATAVAQRELRPGPRRGRKV